MPSRRFWIHVIKYLFTPSSRLNYTSVLLLLVTVISHGDLVTSAHGQNFAFLRGEGRGRFQLGNWGTLGMPHPSNHPGPRKDAVSWKDNEGNLWLFGGIGNNPAGTCLYSDLWKYDMTSNLWVWIHGSKEPNQLGNYATKGTPASYGNPGARSGAVSWRDTEGNLWLFGGRGYSSNDHGYLSDLWKYEISSGAWTWMSGSDQPDQAGVYGTSGTASPANSPGGRLSACSWSDQSGNLWLFGGEGLDSSSYAYLNDTWKYDPLSGTWAWMSGSNLGNHTGSYGIKGAESSTNSPPSRIDVSSWTDASGNLWLFGGTTCGVTCGYFQDLWKHNSSSGQWTWVGGTTLLNQVGSYGSQGVPGAANIPGSRSNGITWCDTAGNLWLFGGCTGSTSSFADLWKYNIAGGTWTWLKGTNEVDVLPSASPRNALTSDGTPGSRYGSASWSDSTGNFWFFGGDGPQLTSSSSIRGDLWKFEVPTGNWAWMGGPTGLDELGIYGIQGTPDPLNTPGPRSGSVSWGTPDGLFWLFGGLAYTNGGIFGDLWKYDLATGYWTWMKGKQESVYGIKGQPAPANTPGPRERSVTWTDNSGNLWLFGGGFMGSYQRNDLWKFSIKDGNWTWVSGSDAPLEQGNYGIKGIPSSSNTPGAREGSAAWSDAAGNLWLFGGKVRNSNTNYFNDLWKYDTKFGTWIWISGSSTTNAGGNTHGPAASHVPGARHGALAYQDSKGSFFLSGGEGYGSDSWMYTPSRGIWSRLSEYGSRREAAAWADNNGNICMFGGYGPDFDGIDGYWNDLSAQSPDLSEGKYFRTTYQINLPSVYGKQGKSNSENIPGSRMQCTAARVGNTVLIFGGYGWGTNEGYLNELWAFYNEGAPETSPTLTAANLDGTNAVLVSFSEPMGPETFNPTNFILSGAGRGTLSPSPHSVTWLSQNTYRLTWNDGAASCGDTLTVMVSPSVKDAEGETMGSPNSLVMYSKCSGRLSFSTTTASLLTTGPLHCMAYGDFNRDGKQDLVVSQATSTGSLLVKLGNGDGTFQIPATYFSGGSFPSAVIAADLNRDGKLDLAASNLATGSVGILLGNGNGVFQTAITYSTGGLSPSAISKGDLDNDGDIDLAVINKASASVAIMSNNGSGEFSTVAMSLPVGEQPASLTLADISRDGALDLLVSSLGDSSVRVFTNTGSGNFELPQILPAHAPHDVLAADFDRDGILEIAAFNTGTTGSVEIWGGVGSGGFQSHDVYQVPGCNGRAAAADYDGDGWTDIATGHYTGENYFLLRNDGNGAFTNPHSYHGVPGSGVLTPLDVDRDGDVDLIAFEEGSEITGFVIENELIHSSTKFPIVDKSTSSSYSTHFLSGDFDRDGLMDLVMDDANIEKIYFGTRDGSTRISNLNLGNNFSHAIAADLDNEGDEDLVLYRSSPGELAVAKNSGDGRFTLYASYSLFPTPISIQSGDLDRDGDVDVVVLQSSALVVFINDGSGSLTRTQSSYPVANTANAFVLTDLNADGKLDAAIAHQFNGVSIVPGLGNGAFALPTNLTGNGLASNKGITAADFNRDGWIDLAVVGSQLVILRNNTGIFSAEPGSPYPIGVGATRPSTCDLNGDGKPDLLIPCLGSNTTTLYYRTGSLFTYGETVAIGGTLRSAGVGDFNMDGAPDIVINSHLSSNLLYNRGGQFALATSNATPSSIEAGTTAPVFRITATHCGRPGDSPVQLRALHLQFDDGSVTPLTTAQVNSKVQSLGLWYDADESGTFSSTSDLLLTTVSNINLDDRGHFYFNVTDGLMALRVEHAVPKTYFLTLHSTPGAGQENPAKVRITHITSASSRGEDAIYGSALRLEFVLDTGTPAGGTPLPVSISHLAFD